MAQTHQRLPVAAPYRKLLAYLERGLVLPKISPNYYDAAGILLSLLFFVIQPIWLKVLVLALVLLSDWLDGATARQCGTCSEKGYITDLVTDRISEGLIFIAASHTYLGRIFFYLWLVNLACACYSLRSNKHVSIALRFIYMVCLPILPNF